MLDVLAKIGFKLSDGQLKFKRTIVNDNNLGQILIDNLGSSSHSAVIDYYQNYSGAERTRKLLDEFISKNYKTSSIDVSKVLFRDELPWTLDQIKIILDQGSPRTSWLVFPKGPADEIDTGTLENMISAAIGDQAEEFLAKNRAVGKVGYFPKNTDYKVVKGNSVYINLWTRPEWETCEEPVYHVEKFEQFMGHFFPVEKDRKFMYAYSRDSVDGRAGAAVILAGSPGTGKNTFVELILGGLVGEVNFRKAVMGEGRGGGAKFHSGVEKCRVRFYDEINLTSPIRNDIKGFMNKTAAVELKGVNISAPYTMHASFVLANNSPSKIELEYDDRKFFVPRLATVKLEDVFGDDWVTDFIEEVQTPAAIKSIYHMCVEKGFGVDTKKPHKTEDFYKYCLNSMPYDIKIILGVLATQSSVEIKKPKYKIEGSEIQQKFDEYFEKSGVVLGKVIFEGRRCTVVRPDYDPNKELEVL